MNLYLIKTPQNLSFVIQDPPLENLFLRDSRLPSNESLPHKDSPEPLPRDSRPPSRELLLRDSRPPSNESLPRKDSPEPLPRDSRPPSNETLPHKDSPPLENLFVIQRGFLWNLYVLILY